MNEELGAQLRRNEDQRRAVLAEAQQARNRLLGECRSDTEEELAAFDIEVSAAVVQTISKCKFQMVGLRKERARLKAELG